MSSTLSSIFALLFSFMLLCLGHGLMSTLISVRAATESFSSISIGFMGFSYFFGFIFGIYLCSKLISIVGHIRTFAAIASITSAISISYLLSVHPISWIIIRFMYGICIASLYMVIETWLNSLATNEQRGQILSIYMILIYACFGSSQYLLNIGTLQDFFPFLIASILLSFSVVPLCVSEKTKQVEVSMETLSLKKIAQASPYGLGSCFVGGVVVGAIWSMMGAYFEMIKIKQSVIPVYLSMIFLGALIFQYPLGKLSDNKISRQTVLAATSLVGAMIFSGATFVLSYTTNMISLSLLFLLVGGTTFPLYSLSMAHVIDHVESRYIMKASGSLLLVNALGSMLGALLSATFMSLYSPNALLYFSAACLLCNTGLSILLKQTKEATATDTPFVAMPRTTTVLQTLDPRVPEEVVNSQQGVSTST